MSDLPTPKEWLERFFSIHNHTDEVKDTLRNMIIELKDSFPDLPDLSLSLFPLGYLYSCELSKLVFHHHPVEMMEALAENMENYDN